MVVRAIRLGVGLVLPPHYGVGTVVDYCSLDGYGLPV